MLWHLNLLESEDPSSLWPGVHSPALGDGYKPMNVKEKIVRRFNIASRYRSRESATQPPKRNVIYLSTANSLEHEMKKLEVAFGHITQRHEIITEAIRKSDGKIIDVVILDTGEEIEVVHKNRDTKTLNRYIKEGITVVLVDVDDKIIEPKSSAKSAGYDVEVNGK